jgi:hypothetical protein
MGSRVRVRAKARHVPNGNRCVIGWLRVRVRVRVRSRAAAAHLEALLLIISHALHCATRLVGEMHRVLLATPRTRQLLLQLGYQGVALPEVLREHNHLRVLEEEVAARLAQRHAVRGWQPDAHATDAREVADVEEHVVLAHELVEGGGAGGDAFGDERAEVSEGGSDLVGDGGAAAAAAAATGSRGRGVGGGTEKHPVEWLQDAVEERGDRRVDILCALCTLDALYPFGLQLSKFDRVR